MKAYGNGSKYRMRERVKQINEEEIIKQGPQFI